MQRVVSVSFGEIVLKGKNRNFFVNKLIKHVQKNTREFENAVVYQDRSKLYVEVNEENEDAVLESVRKVFGIVSISKCYRVSKDFEEINAAVIQAVNDARSKREIHTFKVDGHRADKSFEMNSMELARKMGGVVLNAFEDLKVDVHQPDLMVYVDVREKVYVYTERLSTHGGLPVGTTGKGLILLSGGIDSPVAAYMMAKRGVELSAIHFHSYPFTSDRAKEKVMDLAGILAQYTGEFKIYNINILEIQKAVHEQCQEKNMVIHSRRMMMQIAERIARRNGQGCLITGESLGQVASQTLEGLTATNSSVDIPVFRPLIGMDKTEIMDIAHKIGTYETSILPHDDCCTVFLPKHPATKPRLEELIKDEAVLDVEGLINRAIEGMEIIEIKL